MMKNDNLQRNFGIPENLNVFNADLSIFVAVVTLLDVIRQLQVRSLFKMFKYRLRLLYISS